jgi:aerobic carbon-monoxide dehydrogenase small subunit
MRDIPHKAPTASGDKGVASDGTRSWRLKCSVNGEPVDVMVDPTQTIFHVLREELRLTGTKGACLEGECGSCTILIDGKPVTSCLVLAPQVQGTSVTTVEGLADDDRLHPVQDSFIACGAVQCGYCTPGLVVSAAELLEGNPNPSEEEVRKGLAGNLCRCTGYTKIIDAVLAAASDDEEPAAAGAEP